ncbi:uncharacterized protein LOC143570451 [Bidens hawaiensis]|uniref:uncharacterized protein LOC143570451 n=1 Tax=Bidens hawaiensis TaxID=980011 RepID=UPI00404AFEEA
MKLSLKQLEDQQQNQNPSPILLFKAKIPISVFGRPFLSGFSGTHHLISDNVSISLRTHFLTGPSLKLSYNTTTTTSSSNSNSTAPLTLTLKSGVSLSGSPINSPLVISANFSFSPRNPNPNPTFTIKFTPKLGSFSLRKSIPDSALSNTGKNRGGGGGGESSINSTNSYGFVPLDRPINWKDLSVKSDTKDSILSGIMVAADTELPVTKRVKVNLQWGVGIPSDYKKQLPYLRVNKIKIERVDDVIEEKEDKKQGSDGDSEFEMLKGMYSWMSRELSDLQDENRQMRRALEDIKSLQPLRHHKGYNSNNNISNGGGGGGGKRVVSPVGEVSDGFEQWKMKKNEANTQKETKKNGGAMDVESELQRAIKAASS